MRPIHFLAALPLVVTACDPGWNYLAPGGARLPEPGARFEFAEPPGTRTRIEAGSFTGTIYARVDVQNLDDAPLTVDPRQMKLLDAQGVALSGGLSGGTCEGRHAVVSVLAKGETCGASMRFGGDDYGRLLPQFRTVTLVHDGLSRGAQPLPLRISLVAD